MTIFIDLIYAYMHSQERARPASLTILLSQVVRSCLSLKNEYCFNEVDHFLELSHDLLLYDLLRDKFVLSDACPASVSSLQELRYGLIPLLLLDVLLPSAVHTEIGMNLASSLRELVF